MRRLYDTLPCSRYNACSLTGAAVLSSPEYVHFFVFADQRDNASPDQFNSRLPLLKTGVFKFPPASPTKLPPPIEIHVSRINDTANKRLMCLYTNPEILIKNNELQL